MSVRRQSADSATQPIRTSRRNQALAPEVVPPSEDEVKKAKAKAKAKAKRDEEKAEKAKEKEKAKAKARDVKDDGGDTAKKAAPSTTDTNWKKTASNGAPARVDKKGAARGEGESSPTRDSGKGAAAKGPRTSSETPIPPSETLDVDEAPPPPAKKRNRERNPFVVEGDGGRTAATKKAKAGANGGRASEPLDVDEAPPPPAKKRNREHNPFVVEGDGGRTAATTKAADAEGRNVKGKLTAAKLNQPREVVEDGDGSSDASDDSQVSALRAKRARKSTSAPKPPATKPFRMTQAKRDAYSGAAQDRARAELKARQSNMMKQLHGNIDSPVIDFAKDAVRFEGSRSPSPTFNSRGSSAAGTSNPRSRAENLKGSGAARKVKFSVPTRKYGGAFGQYELRDCKLNASDVQRKSSSQNHTDLFDAITRKAYAMNNFDPSYIAVVAMPLKGSRGQAYAWASDKLLNDIPAFLDQAVYDVVHKTHSRRALGLENELRDKNRLIAAYEKMHGPIKLGSASPRKPKDGGSNAYGEGEVEPESADEGVEGAMEKGAADADEVEMDFDADEAPSQRDADMDDVED